MDDLLVTFDFGDDYDFYPIMVKKLTKVTNWIANQDYPDVTISRMADDGYLKVFGIKNAEDFVSLRSLDFVSEESDQIISCKSKSKKTKKPKISEDFETKQKSTKRNTVNKEKIALTNIPEISKETVRNAVDGEGLIVDILTDYLNTLVECDEALTSTPFLHRCYLNYSLKYHKTNAGKNVILKVEMFRNVLRSIIGPYEVKTKGKHKGWKLGIPKNTTHNKQVTKEEIDEEII
jgi:hypothetical protein